MTKNIARNLIIVMATDVLLITGSWYFANLLRFNFNIPEEHAVSVIRFLPMMLAVKIVLFYLFDLYRGMWRYTGLDDLLNIIKAVSAGSLVVVALISFTHGFAGLARATLIIDWGLTLFLIAGSRVGIRLFSWLGLKDGSSRFLFFDLLKFRRMKRNEARRLLILGAGDCGEKIYREIRENGKLRYEVAGFLDDDPEKIGKMIHNVNVIGGIHDLQTMVAKMRVEEILIAIPSAPSGQMRHILDQCKATGLPFKTVPSMGELIGGKVTVKAIRDVDYRDLLGREVVRLEEERIGAYIKHARVLVTGAGGSIGSELCRQICRFNPERLVLFERAESALYDIDLELKNDYADVKIMPVLADIRDRRQLAQAFSDHKPQVVFHAAAYKHVPLMEVQPWKAVKNNILGTRNVIETAKEFHVDRFVLVSTDKAVRSVNVMGATKRVAEILAQGQNGKNIAPTKFMTVRFGNVVGSIGSVVPLFKKQIERGGPVTVTHPDITRYFMTIPEACQLILQAGAMGMGGEIFILDMGRPVKIVDMARDLIRLSGFEPDKDIRIEYVGLRPGEKLYEELITEGEGILPTTHEKIMVLQSRNGHPVHLNGVLDELARLAHEQDGAGIKTKLREVVDDYQPQEQTSGNNREVFS